jgi:hypothetical protein
MTTLGDGVYSHTVLEHLDSATRMQDRWYLAIGSAAFVGLMVFNMVYGPVVHLWHAVFNFGFPVACIVAMHCSFMVWVHSVAVRGVAARDSAYYHARATADARAAGEAQAEAAGALQRALARFGGNADDVTVAFVQEGPHMLATVATNAGIRRILGTYERECAAAAAPAPASAPTGSVANAGPAHDGIPRSGARGCTPADGRGEPGQRGARGGCGRRESGGHQVRRGPGMKASEGTTAWAQAQSSFVGARVARDDAPTPNGQNPGVITLVSFVAANISFAVIFRAPNWF